MKKIISYFFKTIILSLLLSSFYNFSIAIYIFIQDKNVNEKFKYHFIELEKKENGNYIFSTELMFTPNIAMYLTNWVKVYICTDSNFSDYMLGDTIHIKAKRERSEEKQEYNIIFKPKNEYIMTYDNYECFPFMTMLLHINFNEIEFVIDGLDIPNAKDNFKILLRHESNGDAIILVPYLLKGLGFFILFLLLKGVIILFKKSKNDLNNAVE